MLSGFYEFSFLPSLVLSGSNRYPRLKNMSNDPHINAALWNFCMRANDGPSGSGEHSGEVPQRDPEDLKWLRSAMESVEMPDKTIKRILEKLLNLDKDFHPALPLRMKPTSATSASTSTGPATNGSSAPLALGAPAPALMALPPAASTQPAPTSEQQERASASSIAQTTTAAPPAATVTAPPPKPADDAFLDELFPMLEELQDVVEDLNCAKEFQLMNGCAIVLAKLQSITSAVNAELRRTLLMIIAHASQNLDDLQETFTQLNWVNILVPLLRAEADPSVRAACILACSNLCRGSFAKSGAAFINGGGFEVLETLVRTHSDDDPKTVGRALRLAHHFADHRITSSSMLTLALPLCRHEKEVVASAAAGYLHSCLQATKDNATAFGNLKQELREKLESTLSSWRRAEGELADEQRELLHALK